jgi:hypothetical protein
MRRFVMDGFSRHIRGFVRKAGASLRTEAATVNAVAVAPSPVTRHRRRQLRCSRRSTIVAPFDKAAALTLGRALETALGRLDRRPKLV